MNRKYLLGATVALTSLTTAGILVATNAPDGAASDTLSQSVTPAASTELVMSRQEQRDNTAEQHRISAVKARAAAAARAVAAARAAAL
ncbi:MAG: hypothetical protein M3O55_12665, partial [Actinomycetota bacterium]|nr:hypothetical protein [Actinomycetota bacterium]